MQNTLLACSLEFCTLSEYTENEVKEMFRRQNAGKPLNNKLLRIVHESDEFSNTIHSLASHPFMSKLMTKTQQKNGSDRDLIIQALMLIETNQDQEFISFRTNDIDAFVIEHADSIGQEKIELFKTALDNFDKSFEEKIKVPITSIPMVLYSGYRITKDKKSFSKLIEIINEFLDGYETNEEYKQYAINGTSGKDNVRARFDWWRNVIRSA